MVVYRLDGEKGEGPDLAERWKVHGYPTFLVLDARGEPVARWSGYGTPAAWIASLDRALAEPGTTLAARADRFAASPSAADAEVLAEAALSRNEPREAARYWREAQRLAPDRAASWALPLLQATARGMGEEGFTFDEVKAAADAALAAASPDEKADVAKTMKYAARAARQPDAWLPYLQQAPADPELEVDRALLLEKDVAKAARLKRAAMPPGWEDEPDQLNEYAWWCFENGTNLEEAEALAAKGAELAKTPGEKAPILDTLAEVRFARGDRPGAVAAIKDAIAADPESEYYPKQLKRFE